MLQSDIKADIIISCDQTQMNYIENMPLSSNSYDVAKSYTIKIKKKRHRTAFTTDQLLVLENAFSVNKYIDRQGRKKLADMLMINEKSVKVWFQNRRMKNKRLSDSCDSSSDGNDSTLRVNSNGSSDNYQLSSPYNALPASATDDMNFYPQYNQQQFFGHTHDQYCRSCYHNYNYQYYIGTDYNNNGFNQAWPQQYPNLCHL